MHSIDHLKMTTAIAKKHVTWHKGAETLHQTTCNMEDEFTHTVLRQYLLSLPQQINLYHMLNALPRYFAETPACCQTPLRQMHS